MMSLLPFADRKAAWMSPLKFFVVYIAWSFFGGCRTTHEVTRFDLSEAGWTVRQGQAVWRSPRHAHEMAGELLLATHGDQRSFVEFSKTPLPILTAQTTAEEWRIQFAADPRALAGRGKPPTSLLWLHLARCLNGNDTPMPLRFQRLEDGSWRLENSRSGEVISGFLTP